MVESTDTLLSISPEVTRLMDALNQILLKLSAEVPNLAVFLILVFVFMKSQKTLVTNFIAYMKVKDLELEEVIQDNTDALRENTQVIGAALKVIEDSHSG